MASRARSLHTYERRHPMRYLTDAPFIAASGKQFRIHSSETDFKEVTVVEFLKTVMDNFNPNAQLGHVLKVKEIGQFNEVAKILDNFVDTEIESESPIVLEQAHVDILKKICEWALPIMPGGFMRQAPGVVALLDAIPKEKPEEENSDNNGTSEEPVPENVVSFIGKLDRIIEE